MNYGLLLSLVLAAGAPATPPTPEQTMSEYVTAFNARDAARVAALYSEDAELMPPDQPPIKGRVAIRTALLAQFAEPGTLDFLSVTSTISGQFAAITGRLTISTQTRNHGADIRAGNYLIVLRLVDRQWRIAHHMFTLPLRPDFIG